MKLSNLTEVDMAPEDGGAEDVSSGNRAQLWRDAISATAVRLNRAYDGQTVPVAVRQGASIALSATYKMPIKKVAQLVQTAIRGQSQQPAAGTGDPNDRPAPQGDAAYQAKSREENRMSDQVGQP